MEDYHISFPSIPWDEELSTDSSINATPVNARRVGMANFHTPKGTIDTRFDTAKPLKSTGAYWQS
jgi:hypothetical protein